MGPPIPTRPPGLRPAPGGRVCTDVGRLVAERRRGFESVPGGQEPYVCIYGAPPDTCMLWSSHARGSVAILGIQSLLERAAAGQVLACGAYADGAARVQTVLRAGDGGRGAIARSRAEVVVDIHIWPGALGAPTARA